MPPRALQTARRDAQSYASGDRSEAQLSANQHGKRRRIALACSNCRYRKARCDGGRPKCSLCSELGCECLYEQAGTTTNLTVGRSYLSRLEERLETIETNLSRLQQSQTMLQADTSAFAKTPSEFQPQMKTLPGALRPEITPQVTYSSNTATDDVDTSENAIDGMGAIQFADEQDSGYFGPSSNIAFLRHISLALPQVSERFETRDMNIATSSTTADWMHVSRPQAALTGITITQLGDKVNIYALPPEARTWQLISEYFQKTGQLLPFIHEQSFCDTYFEMKHTGFTMARRTWLGLLNIILAMACTLTVDGYATAEERIAESDVYYQRANCLCERESRRNISLELVQYLLLAGQYLQGTQKSVQAWTVHGLAISTAFQLGLHSPKTNQAFLPVEAEIRKRVWFGCILLDRTLSMTFGRPSIIPEKHVKLKLPSIDIQIMGQTPDNGPLQRMDGKYFQATILLYNIMYEVIDGCFEQNLGLVDATTDTEILSMTLKGDRQLDEWRHQIAPALGLPVYCVPLVPQDLERMKETNKTVERFKLVLSLRFHNLRILNHRVMLEKLLDRPRGMYDNDTGMTRRLYMSSIETCVESATNIIGIVNKVVLSSGWQRDLLGAWNYSLFYTFNAGLVLIAALLVAMKTNDTENVQEQPVWRFLNNPTMYLNMAIEALQNLDRGNRVVQRMVDYLSQLTIAVPNLHIVAQTPDTVNTFRSIGTQDLAAATSKTAQSHARQTATSYQSSSPQLQDFTTENDLSEFMLDGDLNNLFWPLGSGNMNSNETGLHGN